RASSDRWRKRHDRECARRVLDGRGHPRAVVITTTGEIVPFAQVSAEQAYAEGEGDRKLAQRREARESFWRLHGTGSWAFSADMPIVCERFRVVFAGSDSAAANRPDSPSTRFWNGVPCADRLLTVQSLSMVE